jgi:hypothetical protein
MSSQAFELAGSQLKIGNVQIIYRRRNSGEQSVSEPARWAPKPPRRWPP